MAKAKSTADWPFKGCGPGGVVCFYFFVIVFIVGGS